MRIAYLSTDFGIPVCGNKGASIHVRELSAALSNLGHDVEILTSRAGGEAPEGFAVPVREYRLEPQERKKISALKNEPGVADPMVKEIRSMMYAANLRYRVMPHLMRSRPDALYERYSLMGTAGGDIAKSLGIPHVLEVNAPLSEEHSRFRGSAFPDTIRRTEQQILASADEVIAVSEPLRDWIISSGVSPERVTVVPNGVDIERFSTTNLPEQVDPGFDGRPVVGFVGTLKGWHGTSTLIQSIGSIARQRGLERCPRLLIVGDGPERERLESVARDEGIGE
ncbi:MAG: glycosyltransferase, partial [Thermomicrobiales bacterium]